MSRPGTTADAEFTEYASGRQHSLLRTAYLLCGDQHTAEDLVQVTLAKLYLSWDRVRTRGSLDGYTRRILVNEHNSLWRRAWKRRETVTDTPPDHGERHHDTYDDGTADDLWQFLGTLPKRQRTVLVLRFYDDLSDAEIAAALGISLGTVKSQASRALASLRGRVPSSLLPTTTSPEEQR